MQSVDHHLGTSVSEVVAPVADVENSVGESGVGRLTKNERKWARIGTLVAVVVFWLIAT